MLTPSPLLGHCASNSWISAGAIRSAMLGRPQSVLTTIGLIRPARPKLWKLITPMANGLSFEILPVLCFFIRGYALALLAHPPGLYPFPVFAENRKSVQPKAGFLRRIISEHIWLNPLISRSNPCADESNGVFQTPPDLGVFRGSIHAVIDMLQAQIRFLPATPPVVPVDSRPAKVGALGVHDDDVPRQWTFPGTAKRSADQAAYSQDGIAFDMENGVVLGSLNVTRPGVDSKSPKRFANPTGTFVCD